MNHASAATIAQDSLRDLRKHPTHGYQAVLLVLNLRHPVQAGTLPLNQNQNDRKAGPILPQLEQTLPHPGFGVVVKGLMMIRCFAHLMSPLSMMSTARETRE